jgi:molecular chaperone IbpA
MRTYDFTPLWKRTIGFERVFDLVNNSQLLEGQDGSPPYDIVRTGDESYRISQALAGFSADTITVQQNLWTVAARHPARRNEDLLYAGISARPFERRFSLADHVQVEHAAFENGLLLIDLVRKATKPRRIEINGDGQAICKIPNRRPP